MAFRGSNITIPPTYTRIFLVKVGHNRVLVYCGSVSDQAAAPGFKFQLITEIGMGYMNDVFNPLSD